MMVKKISGVLIVLFSCLAFFVVTAEESAEETSDEFAATAGHNYEMVTPEQPTKSGDKIEVLEIFWYGCPHCYDFEPALDEWLQAKPADVEFRRMPGIFRKNWVPHAKAFYTAEKLGIQDKIHQPLFDAIHRDNKRISTDDAVLEFVESLDDVDIDSFKKAYNAFSVESQVKQAMRLSRAYGIRGVPAIIVNGKYWSSGSLAGSYPELLKVVDVLVDKERKRAAGK